MKRNNCNNSYFLTFLAFLAFIPNLNVNAAEIILPLSPEALFEGTEIVFEVKGFNAPKFRWEFDDGSIETSGRRITHMYRGRGTYNVKVFSPNSNILVATKRIRVVKDEREIIVTGAMFFPGTPIKMEARNFIHRSVSWDFGDGKDQKLGPIVTHIYNRKGTYRVKAIDFAGRGTREFFKEIKISDDNRSIAAPKEIIVGEAAEMRLENEIGGNYTWEFSDGQQARGISIKINSFNRPGTITVTIKDNSGRYPPLTRQLAVKPDNRRLKTPLKFALPEETVRFEAENFRGPVKWDFGDGTVKTNGSKRETHYFQEPGNYTVTALDFNGKSQKSFTANISVKELSSDFRLNYLEIAFSNGKYYQVAPLKNQPPSYYVKMKTSGRGILKGKWILDGRPIGLFQVLIRPGEIVHLRGSRVASLPMRDLGNHEFTIEFINYIFQQPIPIIRYVVTEADAIRVVFPEPGAKVTAPRDKPLELLWKVDDLSTVERYDPTYQVMISQVPIRFLTEAKMEWKEAGKENRYLLDLSTLPGKEKGNIWVYWKVRALKSNGDVLTISEVSSFKLMF